MKKIKYLLLIAIICFFVMPSVIRASAPPSRYQVVLKYGQMGFATQTNELERGGTYYIEFFTNGPHYPSESFSFEIDNTILEIDGFYSSYGFEYNKGKIKVDNNKRLEDGYITKEPAVLFYMELKVKDNAKLGKTKINGVSYEIVCSETEKCNEDSDKEEIKKPNTPSQEDNSDIKEEENNNNTNNKVILDDTKFYILAGLLGTVVIEMFVLILKKTKKS